MANTRSKRAADTTPTANEPPKKRATRRAKKAATPEPVEPTPVPEHAESIEVEPEPAPEPASAPPPPPPEEPTKVVDEHNKPEPDMAVDVPVDEDEDEYAQGPTDEPRASDLYLDTVCYRAFPTTSKN